MTWWAPRREVGVAYNDGPFSGTLAIAAASSNASFFMELTVALGHRHDGTASTGVVLDGLGVTNGIDVTQDFTRVEWFELTNHTPEYAILLTASNTRFENLLIHDAEFGFKPESGSSLLLRNSIIYDSQEALHDEGTTATIENCTIYAMATTDGALKEDGGTFTVTNTISMDNGGEDFKDISVQVNNMSSDTSALPVANRSKSSAIQFVNVAGRNFHLQAGADARDIGSSLSFCCDIDSDVRGIGGGWDIGADEFKAQINYRSIGNVADYTTGNIDAVDGWAVVIGRTGAAWISANRGRGDRIDIDGTDYTILSVDSETRLTLTQTVSGNYSGSYTISRQFTGLATALQDWEDCIDKTAVCTYFPASVPSSSLVADDRKEVGIVYDDGAAYTAGVVIGGSVTDASHTITLTVDGDNRHYGLIGQGAVVDMAAIVADAILINDDFVTVEWLEITRGGAEGITINSLNATNRIIIRNVLLQNVSNGDNIYINEPDVVIDVYNNFLYKPEEGIRIGSTLNAGAQIRLLNNTIYDAGDKGIISAASSNLQVTLRNNLVHTTAGNNFGIPVPFNALTSNNLGNDGTGTTHGGSDTAQIATDIFVSPGTGDLHIKTGSDAEDAGADLSAIFTFDIDAATRKTLWDIGADDIVATTAVKLVSFEALGAHGAVELRWETASELDNLGFHLYRAVTEEGPYQRITASLIPGLGSSPAGARYTYRDAGLTNGSSYVYRLEDIDTSGRTELHGPVSATPREGAGSTGGSSDGDNRPSVAHVAYGDPEASSLKVVSHGPREMVLELETRGFYAHVQDDGTVRLEIPGFEALTEAQAPEIPVKRTWVEVLAGRKVKLLSVTAHDVDAFANLHPADTETPEIVARRDGTVRAARRRSHTRARRAVLHGKGLYPSEPARVESVGFQGDVKKALVELAPLRWDTSTSQLLLARRLLVRLSFRERDLAEGPSGGRRRRRRSATDGSQTVARLVTTERGLHAVRYDDVLTGARSLDSRTLRLSRQDEGVAFHIQPDSTRFAPGSHLYFLSEGAEANPYGNEAVYELEVGGVAEAMPQLSAAPSGNPTFFYWKTLAREENRLYQAALLDAPDVWLWDLLFAPELKAYAFEVDDLAPAQPSRLSLWLQGASDFPANPDHHVRVFVNGSLAAESSWDGKSSHRIDVELLPGSLQEGENRLELENVGDTGATYSMVLLNRFEVRHAALPVAETGRLEGTWSHAGVAEVAALGAGGHLLDVTEGHPRWLSDTEAGADGSLRFRAEAGRQYLAVGVDAVLRPEVRKVARGRLMGSRHRADYLVIGPRAFLHAAQPLLKLRQSQGLQVKAVSVEDVYSDFGFGEPSPLAIKDFLSHAYHSWSQPSPRYVLLLGDSTYDFKDYLGTGVRNQVPPLMVKTTYLWTVSDPTYAAVNGDDPLPDLAIGRLPASTVDEVRAMVEKILAYEAESSSLWERVMLVADNPDIAGNFDANLE